MRVHVFFKAGLTAAVAAMLSVVGCKGKKEAPQTATLEVSGQSIPDTPSQTSPPSPDVSEIETVLMPDGKTWMKRNLNLETDESWCYKDDPANCETYGRLYTWDAAVRACAGLGGGWRLPTDKDWNALVKTAGGMETAGTRLKSKIGWTVYHITGTDDFGFSALPGGYRWDDDFNYAGNYGLWWSATEYDADSARYRIMGYDYQHVFSRWEFKSYGFSVRCLRD